MVENGTMPTSRYNVSNLSKHTSIAVEMSILGYQMVGKEHGYSFTIRGVYHLGNAARDTSMMPTKKRKGGCIIIAQDGAKLKSSMRIRHGTTNVPRFDYIDP